MREIIFTGIDLELNIKNGHPRNVWRHGSLIEYDNGQMGIVVNASRYGFGAFIKEVISETVGQYTGLRDKNGKEIYEGDIVRTEDSDIQEIKYIHQEFEKGSLLTFVAMSKLPPFAMSISETDEIIGNIHENPELLKGE